jgi:hypothetical protein
VNSLDGRSTSSLVAAAALCAAATSFGGCSVSSHGTNGAGTLPTAGLSAATRHPDKVIDTTTFTIPAGKKEYVNHSRLIVFASESVLIEGELQVRGGDSTIAFFTPSFRIAKGGKITESSFVLKGGREIVSACQIVLSPGSIWEVPATVDLELAASHDILHGDHCRVVVPAGAAVALTNAPNGNRPNKDSSGENGGSIEIGTLKAVEDADAIAKRYGHDDLKSFNPYVLNLDTALQAASGGSGADDPSGTLGQSGTYAFLPGSGGNGGSVDVDAYEITGTHSKMLGGNGGNGGTVGASLGFAKNPFNGTATSPDGVSVTIDYGAGGQGGSIDVFAKDRTHTVRQPGNGGNASAIVSAGPPISASFFAGDGYTPPAPYPSPPGPLVAGNGGSLLLDLALPGNAGSGASGNAIKPSNGQYPPLTVNGGNGGNPGPGLATFGNVPGGNLIAGGNGGNLTIVPPAGSTPAQLVTTYGLKITLNFGNGGSSLLTGPPPNGGCPSPAPIGIPGGNGGTLHDNGLWPAMYPTLSNYGSGMNAGYGSSGHPPGGNGTNGLDDEGQQIGQSGPYPPPPC